MHGLATEEWRISCMTVGETQTCHSSNQTPRENSASESSPILWMAHPPTLSRRQPHPSPPSSTSLRHFPSHLPTPLQIYSPTAMPSPPLPWSETSALETTPFSSPLTRWNMALTPSLLPLPPPSLASSPAFETPPLPAQTLHVTWTWRLSRSPRWSHHFHQVAVINTYIKRIMIKWLNSLFFLMIWFKFFKQFSIY